MGHAGELGRSGDHDAVVAVLADAGISVAAAVSLMVQKLLTFKHLIRRRGGTLVPKHF